MAKNEKCELTVTCLCYNFEEYIEDALEGFISQKTDFRFKVFVYDDASTDQTPIILRSYAEKYPELFDVYIAEENTFSRPDRAKIMDELKSEHIEGDYVAICEGDDYWCDPNKLQKQVDFLRKHPECSLTVHASHWIDFYSKEEYDFHPYNANRYLTAEEVILQPGGNPSTASYVFRSRDVRMDDSFIVKDVGDYMRQLYELTKGDIYYFNEVMSVYRYGHVGSWSNKYKNDRKYSMEHRFRMYVFLERYDEYTEKEFHEYLEQKKNTYMYDPYLLDQRISLDEYFSILDECDFIPEENRKQYEYGRNKVGAVVRGDYAFEGRDKRSLNKNGHIVIYGCGEYSKYVRNILDKNGYRWDGYVVSDSQSPPEFVDGMKVWKLSEYPYEISETTVVIGVGPDSESTIMKQLRKLGICDVVRPFAISEDQSF